MFNEKEVQSISAKMVEILSMSGVEIKVMVEESSPWWKFGKETPVKNHALRKFEEEKIGEDVVFVFISEKEKRIYVVNNLGICPDSFPESINEKLQNKNFEAAVLGLIDEVIKPLLVGETPTVEQKQPAEEVIFG